VAIERRAPVHAAVVLGQLAAKAGQQLQVALAGARTFAVGLAGHQHRTRRHMRYRPRQQCTGFVALARRQHQHQRVARIRCVQPGFFAHLPAATLQRLRKRAETLHAHQLTGRGVLAQWPALARAQEQHRSLRPWQRAIGEREEQGLQRGVLSGGHRGYPAERSWSF